MAGKDLFAPPSQEELAKTAVFAPPTPQELASTNHLSGKGMTADQVIQNPMFGNHAAMVIPKDQDPKAVDALKAGILGSATLNYVSPDKVLVAQYPRAVATGRILGSIPSSLAIGGGLSAIGNAIPGAAAAAESAANAPGLAGLAARMGIASVQAGTQGAVTGAISKPNEGETRLGNAGKQGIEAAIAAPIIQAATEVPGAIKGAVKSFADKEAFKALNPFKNKMVQKLVQSGQAPEVGATALETGVVGGIPTTKSGIAQRANEAVEQVGEKLGQKIDEIANAADKLSGIQSGKEVSNPLLSPPKVGISRKAIADHLEQELVQDHAGIPTLQDKFSKVQDLIDRFKNGGPDYISIKDAQRIKQVLGKGINWNRLPHEDIPEHEAFDRAIYHTLSSGIEDAADVMSQELGPQFADEYRTLKQQYGNLKTAATIANKASVGEYTNRFISPSDYGVGMFSTLMGGTPQQAVKNAVVGAMANKGIRTFGNQVMATGANGTAQALDSAQPFFNDLGKYSPEIANIISRNLQPGSNDKTLAPATRDIKPSRMLGK